MRRMNEPQNENTSTVVIALGFNVGIRHQEHGQDYSDNIPSWEDQTRKGGKKKGF